MEDKGTIDAILVIGLLFFGTISLAFGIWNVIQDRKRDKGDYWNE